MEQNNKKYKCVTSHRYEADSPCDLCELDFCIGVQDCEEEYGDDSYFKEIKS